MAKRKGIPSNWVLTNDLGKDQFIVESEEFTEIAFVPVPVAFDASDQTKHVKEWMVNARLISKAPAMYHLLRRVQQMIVAENLMGKYVSGEASKSTDDLTKEISILLRQIDEGGSSQPKKLRLC